MELFGTSVTTTVLAMAAIILALSVLVQVLQELWKYLTSSKSKCFVKVLEDSLGPIVTQMRRENLMTDFATRGPLQLRRLSPNNVMLPLPREELVEGLESTATPWQRRTLRALRVEADLQAGSPAPTSPEWRNFLAEMEDAKTAAAALSHGPDIQATEILDWVHDHGLSGAEVVDARKAVISFRERFLPDVVDAEKNYPRLEQNYQYRYRRRNMRQTFLFGFLVAAFAHQPIQEIYSRARELPPSEASAMAEAVVKIYQAQLDAAAQPGDTTELAEAQMENLQRAQEALAAAGVDSWTTGLPNELRHPTWPGTAFYLLGCALTAVLLSFGAPFWNDLVGRLAPAKLGSGGESAPAGGQESGNG